MKTINQTYQIKAPIEEVWKALVDPTYIDKWGGGPAKMSDEEGFEFSLWDGEIYGKNIEVVPFKKLTQEWIEGKWDKASIVIFTLKNVGESTYLDLVHSDFPQGEYDDLDTGWRDFYLEPLKDFLENKSNS